MNSSLRGNLVIRWKGATNNIFVTHSFISQHVDKIEIAMKSTGYPSPHTHHTYSLPYCDNI